MTPPAHPEAWTEDHPDLSPPTLGGLPAADALHPEQVTLGRELWAGGVEVEVPVVPRTPEEAQLMEAAPCEARRIAGQIEALLHQDEVPGDELALLALTLAAVAIRDGETLDRLNIMLSASPWPGHSAMEDVAEVVAHSGRVTLGAEEVPAWRAH